VGRTALEREVASAGWVIDSDFSEDLIIGNANDLCILLPERSWQRADTEYELYDVEKNVACWVRAIPTPYYAARLLQECGQTPTVDERGETIKRKI